MLILAESNGDMVIVEVISIVAVVAVMHSFGRGTKNLKKLLSRNYPFFFYEAMVIARVEGDY